MTGPVPMAGETSLADTWPGALAIFTLFALFLFASFGYGAFLRRRLSPRAGQLSEAADAALIASAILYVAAFTLCSFGALRLAAGWVYALLLYPGLMASLPFLRELRFAAWERRRAGFFAFGLLFVVAAYKGARPLAEGGALVVHLEGARVWASQGGFHMLVDLPAAAAAGPWDCLYVWPELFWRSAKPLHGLVEAQVFAQWLQYFLAGAGCALLLMRLARGHVREALIPWVGLATLSWAPLAASDEAGTAFWSLGAFTLLLEAARGKTFRWRIALSGMLAGLALAGRPDSLLPYAPLLLSLIFTFRRSQARESALWWACFGIAAGTHFVRNRYLTGYALFPFHTDTSLVRWFAPAWRERLLHDPLRADPATFAVLMGSAAILAARLTTVSRLRTLLFTAFVLGIVAAGSGRGLPPLREPLGLAKVATHPAGEAKAWVRAQSGNRFALLSGNDDTYYLAPAGAQILEARPDLAALFSREDVRAFLADLCRAARVRYLIAARPATGVEARYGGAALAPAKVFEAADGASVFDLQRLYPPCQ